jgi:hypothetical protein
VRMDVWKVLLDESERMERKQVLSVAQMSDVGERNVREINAPCK